MSLTVRSVVRDPDQAFRPGIPYKKAGVMLFDLYRKEAAPLTLFDDKPPPRGQKLMRAFDSINQRHWRNQLRPTSQAPQLVHASEYAAPSVYDAVE